MEKELIEKNMIEVVSAKDIQESLLYLMRELHTICEENQLVYNIFGGTLLGAIRHGGFIPWDDDIDITMPRYDYEKLKTIVGEKYSDRFAFECFPQKDYCYPFGKFVLRDSILIESMKSKYGKGGLYIDVFPVDGYPSVEAERKHFKTLQRLKYFRCKCVLNNSSRGLKRVANTILTFFCQMIGVGYFVNKEIETVKKYDFSKSEYVLCQGAGWYDKGKLKKDDYLERKLYRFENTYFWGIKNYDGHLRKLYGDYMKLPPEERRVSEHNYKLYISAKVLHKIKEEKI